jgi:hypothetical protein
LAAIIVSRQLDVQYDIPLLVEGLATSIVMGPVFALCAYAIHVMVAIRPARLTVYLYGSVRQYLTRARMMRALPLLLLFSVFTAAFTFFKAAIPLIHPYAWDARLSQWDLSLHGGAHPWVWLQSILGHPLLSSAINISYHLWFFIVIATLYWLAFTMDRRQLRMQFMLSFVVSWIVLGNVVATLFSSVGPCYYGFLAAGPDPYAPLMSYLHEANRHAPIWALDVQKLLWDGYRSKLSASELGISAMPSMHVATSMLLALFGWRINRASGIALSLFTLLIMIGSVHLGWHYALDGYVGAAGAYAIWHTVGWMLSKSPLPSPASPLSPVGSPS